jgi:hypothetical protein
MVVASTVHYATPILRQAALFNICKAFEAAIPICLLSRKYKSIQACPLNKKVK